jgi:hypothetical protein
VFDLYYLTEAAKTRALNPDAVLSKIQVSRAFNCYQLTSLILKKLPSALVLFKPNNVIILNITDLFTDPEVPTDEAKVTFLRISEKLRHLARTSKTTFIVGNPLTSGRASFSTQFALQQFLSSCSDVVVFVKETKRAALLIIQKNFLSSLTETITIRKEALLLGNHKEFSNPMAILPHNLLFTRIR